MNPRRALWLVPSLVALASASPARGADAPPPPAPAAPAAPVAPASPTPPAPPGGAPNAPAAPPPAAAPADGAVVVPTEVPYPSTGELLRLTLAEALRLGAARNLELLAGAYDPAIACAQVDVADGLFDTLLTAGFEGGHRESPSNFSFAGTDVTQEDYLTASAGVSRRFRDGSSLAAVFRADRLDTNNAVTTIDPSWTTGASVEYVRPLLRGAGDVATADVRKARAAARAADQGLLALTDNVVLRIESAYWNLAFAHAQWAARRKSEQVAAELLAQAEARFAAQVATVLDLAEARAGLESRRGDRIAVEGALGVLEDELRALILPFEAGGRAATARLVPVDDVRAVPASDAVEPADVERYVGQALRARPDLLAARAQLEGLDISVEQAVDATRPQLDLFARLATDGLDRGLGSSFAETTTGQATSASVGLAFSVYLGRRSAFAGLQVARWTREQAGVRLREAENRTVQEVRAALLELSTARARARTAAGEIVAAREALEGEQLKEKNGESTPFRVLQKEEDLTQAVTRENRALADVRIAVARLWKATGLLASSRRLAPPTAR